MYQPKFQKKNCSPLTQWPQLDFERYQGRVDSSKKKTKRSDRDNASLAKSEGDLSKAKEVNFLSRPSVVVAVG